MHTPRYDRHFIIHTDASDTAVGDCLSQIDDDGVEVPIAFCSAKLAATQLARPIIEKEAYSILYCLSKFDVFVFNSRIELFTDHNPLQYVILTLPQGPRLVSVAGLFPLVGTTFTSITLMVAKILLPITSLEQRVGWVKYFCQFFQYSIDTSSLLYAFCIIFYYDTC